MLDTKRATTRRFQLILIKPSHYDADGYVVQWLRSTMPSNSLAAVFSLANGAAERSVLGPDLPIDVIAIDETNTRVVPQKLMRRIAANGGLGLVGIVGVQSNEFPRAVDIARPLRAGRHPGDDRRLPRLRLPVDAARRSPTTFGRRRRSASRSSPAKPRSISTR